MENIVKLVWSKAGTPPELFPLLETLGEEFPVSGSGKGLKVEFKRIQNQETVSNVIRSKGKVLIEYSSLTAAARGLGSALAGIEGRNVTSFTTLGIMLDVSRNMVMKVDALKRWFRLLALAGHNTVMLYTEDTYELEDVPVFGYMRGGYSLEEIRELDEYAKKLGIELVGCIQTLGHMEQILQWSEFSKIRDTRSVMLADQPETFELIEKMLSFWKEALSSERIHIGMDETHDLGRGVFLDRYGYERGFDIFNRHLQKVNALCKKYELQPMIWSDMYFRLSNPQQEYYDLNSPIPADVRDAIPKNVQLVYWDYYHRDPDFYSAMLRRHRELGFAPVMASGIWTWPTFWYNHPQTAATAAPCIEACRKEKVKELIFTMWGDDGAFCNINSALAGIFYTADLAYGENAADNTSKRFDVLCAPTSYASHLAAAEINLEQKRKDGSTMLVMSSYLVWDDPLMGIALDGYLRNDPEFDLKFLDSLEEIQCRILPFIDCDGAGDIEHVSNLISLLIKKIEMRGALTSAYEQGDRMALREIAVNVIPSVIAAVEEFDVSFRRQWMSYAKPFGIERIQSRNAAQIARLQETALRIREFLSGEVERIEELECRLPRSTASNEHYGRYALVSSGSSII